MSGGNTLTREDEIDVAGIFTALARNWLLIAIVTLVSGVGLFLLLSSIEPRYASSARILIKDGNSAFTRVIQDTNQVAVNTDLDQQAIRSEVEVASSNRLILDVMDQFKLYEDSDFVDDKESGFFSFLSGDSQEDAQANARNKALETFRERLTVFAVEQSRVIVFEFWAHDPELARDIVNALSQGYIGFKRDLQQDVQQNATTWLDPRIVELEAAVSDKEAAVANYRANEDLLRSNDNDALLATQQLSQVSTELSRLKAQRSSAQARVAAIKSALDAGSSIDVIPQVVESNLIQRLREREVALRAQITDLSTTLLPNHPRMKSLNSQLSGLQNQITSAAQNIVQSLERNVAATREAETDLAKEMLRLKSEASRVDEKLVELRALEREAETARNLLAEYKSRSLEAKSRQGLAPRDAEIISPASLANESYFPKVIPFTAVGTLAVFVLMCLGVIAMSLLTTAAGHAAHQGHSQYDPAFNHAGFDDLQYGGTTSEEELQVSPFAGDQQPLQATPAKLPKRKKAQPQPEIAQEADSDELPVSPFAVAPQAGGRQQTARQDEGEQQGNQPAAVSSRGESLNDSALAVRFAVSALGQMEEARIAVISPGGRNGSQTAAVLARQLAAEEHSVLVIECVANGMLSEEMLGKPNLPGLFNYMSGSATAEHVVFQDRYSGAHVMPVGSQFPGPVIAQPQALSDIVDSFSEYYDYCIIDCGQAALGEVNIVADDETLAVISCIDASPQMCRSLEEQYQNDGFENVIRLMPDAEDFKSTGRNARRPATRSRKEEAGVLA